MENQVIKQPTGQLSMAWLRVETALGRLVQARGKKIQVKYIHREYKLTRDYDRLWWMANHYDDSPVERPF